ncbi:MAG: UbiX family flavin prenyltransferase [Proteobacteria bacterium]|nr:UbiX family flavin prenyltransferase [Desulfobacteraceae bacterium]MBU4011912.1 UbiX family flavin prenyltransferase [Pseudomonadota bacterium]MBU4067495.1 UbiX family flavin prenyltransferase [Pseudomonadota bacterium]MBU4102186.1 UbiX family flavin prenyltransferase [Pseudomonadota bacterium]MBU4128057.1 UbiX family flavin prenyltransferase [Pseudomonadota bacterium]
MNKKIVVAICGASGSIYGIRLLKALLKNPINIYLIISNAGYKVLEHETGYRGESFSSFLKDKGVVIHNDAVLNIYEQDDFFAPPASGSFRNDGMVIVPCSMKTLGAIASGIADNLIHRAADVNLKEKRPLILLPRETPLSLIHLKNMYMAAKAGATIMPPSPSFYSNPQSIFDLVDSVIARVLDHLKIEHDLVKQWGDNIV